MRRLILDGAGITVQTQKLVHNGVVVMDGTTLVDNEIGRLATLHMG